MEQQNDDFDEIVRGEFEGRTTLVAELDACRLELTYQLTEMATQLDNDPNGHGTLEIDISTHREKFKNLARDILDTEGDDTDNVAYIVEALAVESQARTDVMTNILNVSGFEALSRDTIADIMIAITRDANNYEEMLERFADTFEIDLKQDIDMFVHSLLAKHNRSPHAHEQEQDETSIIEVRKELRDHVADVVKIAAGVTIALTLDKFLRRKS